MKRRKRSKCRSGWKQCGDSPRCWPPETKCSDLQKNNEKPKEKVQTAEKHIPIGKIVAASVAGTAIIGGLSYAIIESRKKTNYIPEKADTSKLDSMYPSDKLGNEKPIKTIATSPMEMEGSDFKNRGKVNENILNEKIGNQYKARQWAKNVLDDPNTVILDLETTALMQGVDPYNPESWRNIRRDVPGITQIAMIDGGRKNGFDIKLNPERKMSNPAVAEMTGYDEVAAQNKPTFKQYYPKLKKLLTGKRVLAFNGRFDFQVLDALCENNNLPLIQYANRPMRTSFGTIERNPPMSNDADVMHWFALYKYKSARASTANEGYDTDRGLAYTSLPTIPNGNAHDALTDVLSTYDALRIMAEGRTPYGMSRQDEIRWNNFERRKKHEHRSARIFD